MDPTKPTEVKLNTDNNEITESFEETGFNNEPFNIEEQKPNLAETGFNTDKADITQRSSQTPPLAQNDQPVTNTTAYSQNTQLTDNISADTLIQEIIKLDPTSTKPGKRAKEELFKKAGKSQV